MTLTEYLNQKEPVRMPTVIVDKKEYKVIFAHKAANGEVRKRVCFKSKNNLLAGIEYCLIGNRFYTTDRDGNPKDASCFKILTSN
jgi:spore coat polysaccharide biosynthesis predicted glycosyltransferase SpsG